MTNSLQESELKSLLSSTARRQNLLAGLHPSARAAPLLAFAVAGLINRRIGVDLTDGLLGGEEVLQIGLPAAAFTASGGLLRGSNGSKIRIFDSCANCSGSKGEVRKVNVLGWMLDRSS